ncbi:4Fe-4S dicluster domain-containing protein [Tepidibacter thalassicus DSM 15285]|nr:4Fe-4S dicluster domain-containing protein [Tepidibacter thalassicus DSM 15285]
MVGIRINGKNICVPKDYTILKACESIGINIPTFCHDDRLVPDAACRMCVVEVVGAKNLLTACSTPVTDGMEIYTHSEKVIEARKEILRLILSNHPMDCLTCEKAGNCKLQNYCYEYEVKEVNFDCKEKKFDIDDSNPFYYFDQNKCIMCGKCVRVCSELQCSNAISISERGFETRISTPFNKGIENSDCVSCGNCVSVCPVGALMPKSNEKFRAWEVRKVRTTCSYCGVGCQMDLLVKDDNVVGVEPANGPSNKGLLCVKGKFGYRFINHSDRLKKPLVKRNGKFEEVSWKEAYDIIATKVNYIKTKYGADSFAGLTSARCTNEENYLFQKLFRAVIGTNNVDHCARL